MSLRNTLERILDLLTKQPNIETQAKLKASAEKLQKAAASFQEQLEFSAVENSVEYATLAGFLNDPAKKKIITFTWAKNHLEKLGLEGLEAKSFTATAKKQFLLQIISSGLAKEIIRELSQSAEERLQDEFAKLARSSDSQVRAILDQDFKAAKLALFCEANGIIIARKKSGVDRKMTYSHIFSALAGFRERLKL